MYISEFICGALATIVMEIILLIVAAVLHGKKKR